jgi:biopolymer transport protein ExbD
MKFTSDAQDEPEINMISLIDVILVLLIFFMATATFEQQSRLKLNLPKASEVQTEADRAQSLVLQITEQGDFFVGNQQVSARDVETLKSALRAAAGVQLEQRVSLRADARTQHQSVVMALDALGQVGFANISIATIQKER